MFKATLRTIRDLLTLYAIFQAVYGFVELGIEIRDHFRKFEPQN